MTRDTIFSVGVCVLLCASVGANVMQARRGRALAGELRFYQRSGGLASGARLPDLKAQDLSGKQVDLRYDSPTVIYVFSPFCGWCRRNEANIRQLAKGASAHYRFVGISLVSTGLADFLDQHGLPFSAYANPDPDSARSYKLDSTPELIVVAPGGVLVRAWKGAFVGETKSEIESFFSVRLPGIAENGPGTFLG